MQSAGADEHPVHGVHWWRRPQAQIAISALHDLFVCTVWHTETIRVMSDREKDGTRWHDTVQEEEVTRLTHAVILKAKKGSINTPVCSPDLQPSHLCSLWSLWGDFHAYIYTHLPSGDKSHLWINILLFFFLCAARNMIRTATDASFNQRWICRPLSRLVDESFAL